MKSIEVVEELNTRYFNGELSKKFKEKLGQWPVDRPDVLAFLERTFNYICTSTIPPKDLSLLQAEVFGSLLARILPGAWEGRVPPITVSGRHASIDEYVKLNKWITSGGKTMLDIGCGFPPYTTIESASYLPEWTITGADPSLPIYLVYDEEGNYATMDEDKSIVYFQPAAPTIENWNKLLADSSMTRHRFRKLLDELLISGNGSSYPKVKINPIKNYETKKLSFIKGGIGQIEIEPKDVIRCFNVLYYFTSVFQDEAKKWFGEKLKEGGILIFGGDWAISTECYYDVYKKNDGRLIKKEFAFSLDCICPFGIATWYALHDDDPQKVELVKCIGLIRENKSFMESFYNFHDAQRLKYNICPRDDQGYYGDVDAAIEPQVLWPTIREMLNELNDAGYNQKAADVLCSSGINATVNEVGHIAIIH